MASKYADVMSTQDCAAALQALPAAA
jgi:hypothetical protein